MEWPATYFVIAVALFTLGNEVVKAAVSLTFDVMEYGATGSGTVDNRNAFLKAWGEACECGDGGEEGAPTFYVPAGKFLLNPVYFHGPCKASSINVQIDGTLVAPNSTHWNWRSGHVGTWLAFAAIDNLIVGGSGTIDAQGSSWWGAPARKSAARRPTSLSLRDINNLLLSGLHFVNSPRNHISIERCDGSTICNLTIDAPATSPNTDGIDISESTNVKFHDLDIQTGDDCIALGNKANNIIIERVACGPGHGISIGSLGRGGAYDTVEQVQVLNCTFRGSTNGARIKTWLGGSGYVRNIVFDQISLDAVENPIIINQFYEDKNRALQAPSSLEVSNVTFRGIKGTSVGHPVITLNCSDDPGCSGIILDDIQIAITSTMTPAVVCSNAHGSATSTSPEVTCLLS